MKYTKYLIMNKNKVKTLKSTAMAIMFFGLMTIVATLSVQAQTDLSSPLITTTGPNVLGAGHIQWYSSVEGHDASVWNTYGFDAHSYSFGATTGMRFGVGSRAELAFSMVGNYNMWDTTIFRNTLFLRPAVGARLLLTEGKGWVPQITFFTQVGVSFVQPLEQQGEWDRMVHPELGLQCRNRLGQRWLLDYTLGYSWNKYSLSAYDFENEVLFALAVRYLVSNRLLLGVAVSNMNSMRRPIGEFEVGYLASPDLQLTFRAGVSGSRGSIGGDTRANALAGVSWMIR